jgi:hypothetical protein
VPPCILAHLNNYGGDDDPLAPFSLIHPDMSGASSFLNDHISSRFPDDLLREHYLMASRGGLILFRRCRNFSNKLNNLCVYDPLSGHRTFFQASSQTGFLGMSCSPPQMASTAPL